MHRQGQACSGQCAWRSCTGLFGKYGAVSQPCRFMSSVCRSRAAETERLTIAPPSRDLSAHVQITPGMEAREWAAGHVCRPVHCILDQPMETIRLHRYFSALVRSGTIDREVRRGRGERGEGGKTQDARRKTQDGRSSQVCQAGRFL
jgi:hypothetical protein